MRKKQGSSLIIVIIVFMFISIVSVVMLSMVSLNYNTRIRESKRVENMYSSESGLDIAYNIVGKTFDAGAQYGNLKAKKIQSLNANSSNDETSPYNDEYIDIKKDIEKLEAILEKLKNEEPTEKRTRKDINRDIHEAKEKIEKDKKMLETIVNEEFKRAFSNFLVDLKDSDTKGEKENIPSKLKNSIENKEYINKVKEINNQEKDYVIEKINFQESNNPKFYIKDDNCIKYDKGELGEAKECDLENGSKIRFDIYNNQTYKLKITSQFECNKNIESTGKNHREVEAIYEIKVPDYSDIYFSKSNGKLEEYTVITNNGITVGKDLSVENVKNLSVDGQVFVSGEEKILNDKVYDKYKGGIQLKESENISFNDDIVCANTFNIQDNVNVDLNGDLYSKNIYAGQTNKSSQLSKEVECTENSNLKANNEVVIDNDLTVKAVNTNISIKNFYGINDKNIYYKDLNNEIDNENYDDKVKTSSSIIINGYEKEGKKPSSVNITDRAYIMGTAHIDTKDDYQTGESAAVKGNYIAYSIPLNEYEKFKYDKPLQVLDENNVFKKANHFAEYWNENSKEHAANGGISLPKDTYSVGAVVCTNKDNTEVRPPNYSIDSIEDVITDKRRQFANRVNNLGESIDLSNAKKEKLSELDELYNRMNPKYTVSDLLDFSVNLEDKDYNYTLSEEMNKNGEKAIFNTDSTQTIVISGKNSSKKYNDSNDYILINGTKELKCVIATSGDIIIDGDVNLKGNLVTQGSLFITGKKSSTRTRISYDEDVVDSVQSKHPKLFADVFGKSILINTEEDEDNNTKGVLNSNYDFKKFVIPRFWNLIK